ncbi:MAG: hypothetical protein ACI9EZ_002005 [Halobacteriales archaeon]|jgi:hypothetical protein
MESGISRSFAARNGGNEAIFGPIGHGGVERLIVSPAMLRMMAFGGYLLGTATNEGCRPAAERTEPAD